MRELEQSRAHVVDDSAARLRRIERDLHDGAQAQMVAVAMKLGLAREKLGSAVAGEFKDPVKHELLTIVAATNPRHPTPAHWQVGRAAVTLHG